MKCLHPIWIKILNSPTMRIKQCGSCGEQVTSVKIGNFWTNDDGFNDYDYERDLYQDRKKKYVKERTKNIVKDKLIEEKYGKPYEQLSFREQMNADMDLNLDLKAELKAGIDAGAEMKAEMEYEMNPFRTNTRIHRTPTYSPKIDNSVCFIATAAYGTPFAQEINILRNWRDNSLSKNLFGKIFIKVYYKISPPIADYIKNKNKIRKMIRMILKPLVNHLNKKSLEF